MEQSGLSNAITALYRGDFTLCPHLAVSGLSICSILANLNVRYLEKQPFYVHPIYDLKRSILSKIKKSPGTAGTLHPQNCR